VLLFSVLLNLPTFSPSPPALFAPLSHHSPLTLAS
jgi:hypothetical protein